jgi:hypothetical protein
MGNMYDGLPFEADAVLFCHTQTRITFHGYFVFSDLPMTASEVTFVPLSGHAGICFRAGKQNSWYL